MQNPSIWMQNPSIWIQNPSIWMQIATGQLAHDRIGRGKRSLAYGLPGVEAFEQQREDMDDVWLKQPAHGQAEALEPPQRALAR